MIVKLEIDEVEDYSLDPALQRLDEIFHGCHLDVCTNKVHAVAPQPCEKYADFRVSALSPRNSPTKRSRYSVCTEVRARPRSWNMGKTAGRCLHNLTHTRETRRDESPEGHVAKKHFKCFPNPGGNSASFFCFLKPPPSSGAGTPI